MKIGFIGVGLMGGPLARNLIRDGREVLVFDLSQEAVEHTLQAGETGVAVDRKEDLAVCDVIFSSLPLPKHVSDAFMDQDGLYAVMKKGSVHVELSTIAPTTSKKLENTAGEGGLLFLQCTLGKTPAHAEKAEEPLFIGGNKEVYESLKDIWPVIGSPAYYMGGVEAACAVKLISNLIGMTNLATLAEGMRLGEKAGIEPQYLLELLDDTGAKSFQMDVRGPWIAAGDFSPRFGLDLALKDVRLGCEMADSWDVGVPTMEAALKLYKKASTSGLGVQDCNAVFQVVK